MFSFVYNFKDEVTVQMFYIWMTIRHPSGEAEVGTGWT